MSKQKMVMRVIFFGRHRTSGEVKLIQVCWVISDEKTFNRELRGLKSAMDELKKYVTLVNNVKAQGNSLAELEENLEDTCKELQSGDIPCVKRVAELEVA